MDDYPHFYCILLAELAEQLKWIFIRKRMV